MKTKKDWHKEIKELVNDKNLFPEMTVQEFIDRVRYEKMVADNYVSSKNIYTTAC